MFILLDNLYNVYYLLSIIKYDYLLRLISWFDLLYTSELITSYLIDLIFFFDLRGCPGQLARTTTNPTAHWTPCKPNEHVRHREVDRRAHEDLNPGAAGGDKPLLPPGQDPQCYLIDLIDCVSWALKKWFYLFNYDSIVY